MKKGCPCGQPFHCRAVIRLNLHEHTVFKRCGPPWREGSSSRMPAIAAIDNETLDHLLSVVDDARNLTGVRALSKPGRRDPRQDARVAGDACSARRIAGAQYPAVAWQAAIRPCRRRRP